MNRISRIVIGFLLIFFVGGFGAVIVDYGLHRYITNRTFFVLVASTGVISAVAKTRFGVPLPIVAGCLVGVVMIPYIQFFIGKIDLYAIDPPEMRESVTATEIRLDMGQFIMRNSLGQDIAVIKDIPTKTLYPGANEVHIGTMDMPPGTYVSGSMDMERIEVDINIDIDKEIDIQMATLGSLLPSQVDAGEIRRQIKDEFFGSFSENLGSMAPAGVSFTNVHSDESRVYFTVVVDPPLIPIPFPMQIPYPTGTGGPDITIDIILDSAGYPSSIKPIIHLPPGAPQIDIPDIAPDITRYGAPTAIGPSDSDIDVRIQQEMQARAGPGGCLSEAECQIYCSDEAHQDECLAYARAQGIDIPEF